MRVRWIPFALMLVAAAGLVVVARHLAAIDSAGRELPFELPWEDGGGTRYLWTLGGIALALAIAARVLRLSAAASTVVTIAVAYTLLAAAWPLLVVAALSVASAIVGRVVRIAWRDDRIDPLTDVVVGWGAYASLVGWLAHVPVNTPALYAILIAAPIVWRPRMALNLIVEAAGKRDPQASPSPLCAWIAGVFAVLYALVALLPEFGWDALVMHEFIPAYVLAHREWSFDASRYSWAVMPALGDWLYTIVYAFDGERGARVTNALCSIVVAAWVHRLARFAGATPRWAWFASALWLSTPVVFAVGSSLFIDAVWTSFMLAGLYAMLVPGVPGQPPRAWITAALLFGFAAAAKATTLPMLAVVAIVAFVLLHSRRAPGTARVIALAAVAFLASGAKPYATAWLLTGNPVYPFYTHVFGSSFDYWTTGPSKYRAPLSWGTLVDMTFDAKRYIEGRIGSSGFQWLLVLPAAIVALVVCRARRGLLLALIGLLWVIAVFRFQSYLRYVLPGFALLVAAFAAAGSVIGRRSRAGGVTLAVAAAIATLLNAAYLNAATTYPTFPIRALVDERLRRELIAQSQPVRLALEFALRLPTVGTRLGLFGSPTLAFAPYVEILHPSWYMPAFDRAVSEARTPDALARTLLAWNIRYVVVDDWVGRPEVWQRLEAATEPVAEFAGASVRAIRAAHRYEGELLVGPELSQVDRWSVMGTARHDAANGTLTVTVEAPAYQVVEVTPGVLYRNAVRARCETGGAARVQVNWLDAKQNFIRSALQVFECNRDWIEKAQEVVAPRRAAFAVVYASSHDGRPVEFDSVSFRGPAPP